MNYFRKMKGTAKSPPRVNLSEIIWSWVGAFLGVTAVAIINYNTLLETDLVLLIGGHVFSAVVGVAAYQLLQEPLWLSAAVAVATSIAVMHATRTMHPPGGATALIAVIGSAKIHELGYLYALMPAGAGAIVMLVVALLVNNIPKGRKYPEYWY